MSIETLRSLIPTIFTDVVGIYTQNFRQVFAQARPVKVTVKPEAKIMEHPLETGATIVDHSIFLPIEIEVSIIIPALAYRNTYQEIQQLFLDRTLLTVQTKASVFSNQLIVGIPHDEDPDMFDAITLALKMKEVQFVTPQYGVLPKRPQDANNMDKGNQQSTSTDVDVSRAKDAYNRA